MRLILGPAPANDLFTACLHAHTHPRRTTVNCYVFGPQGCGKSALLRALASRQGDPSSSEVLMRPHVAVGVVSLEEGLDKVLVMTEVS